MDDACLYIDSEDFPKDQPRQLDVIRIKFIIQGMFELNPDVCDTVIVLRSIAEQMSAEHDDLIKTVKAREVLSDAWMAIHPSHVQSYFQEELSREIEKFKEETSKQKEWVMMHIMKYSFYRKLYSPLIHYSSCCAKDKVLMSSSECLKLVDSAYKQAKESVNK